MTKSEAKELAYKIQDIRGIDNKEYLNNITDLLISETKDLYRIGEEVEARNMNVPKDQGSFWMKAKIGAYPYFFNRIEWVKSENVRKIVKKRPLTKEEMISQFLSNGGPSYVESLSLDTVRKMCEDVGLQTETEDV